RGAANLSPPATPASSPLPSLVTRPLVTKMPLDFHASAMKKNDRSFLLRCKTSSRRYRHMAKLSPETLRERSDHILDAAERCFARAGFHRTTMQDICREAEVS